MLTLRKKFDMINAWSLAWDALNGTMDEEYPIIDTDDDIDPYEYYDTSFNGSDVDLSYEVFKYDEDQTLDQAKKYIKDTYSQHYSNGNFQTLDLIESIGDAEAFCRSNAIKYLSRYNKKGRPQDDILKAVHYCVLLYYFSK
tara:strand:- start:1785 stop:2207 length:423 start_codon:yes stop_codon:yes gene_type:complete